MMKIESRFFFGSDFPLFGSQFCKLIMIANINMRFIYRKVFFCQTAAARFDALLGALLLHTYAAKATYLCSKSYTVIRRKLHSYPAATACLHSFIYMRY
jgi:hypothetical protein